MKLLVGTLLASISQLGEILLFACFFFLIYAILGVSLWTGLAHYRCRETAAPVNGDWPVSPDDTRLCGARSCPSGLTCGSLLEAEDKDGYSISGSVYRDTHIEDLNWGMTTFDNVPRAFITVFQTISGEGWTGIMDMYNDAYLPILTTLYFVSCVIICSFFIINLTVAVMLDNYSQQEKQNE